MQIDLNPARIHFKRRQGISYTKAIHNDLHNALRHKNTESGDHKNTKMQIERKGSILKVIKMLRTKYNYRIVYMGSFVMGCNQRKFKTHKGL